MALSTRGGLTGICYLYNVLHEPSRSKNVGIGIAFPFLGIHKQGLIIAWSGIACQERDFRALIPVRTSS